MEGEKFLARDFPALTTFSREEGVFEEAHAQTVQEVVAWQLAEMSATLLQTGRSAAGSDHLD
jgi:hypothetical protein